MLGMEDMVVEEEEQQQQQQQESSECSSGCQSGWTMYLDHSYETSLLPFYKGGGGASKQREVEVDVEEEEEDLSMVSDASSGPPHFLEEDCNHHCHCSYDDGNTPPDESGTGKRRRVAAGQQQQQHPTQQQMVSSSSSFLDDTASSPLFTFSKNKINPSPMKEVMEFSSCFSATHFKGKPQQVQQKYAGYMQASSPLKPTSAKQVCSEECEEKMW